MNVDIHGAPIWFTIGNIQIASTLVITWCIMALVTGLCIWMTHDMKVQNISKKQAVAEFLVQTCENFVRSNMGEKNLKFVPMIATIMVLSVLSSLSSLFGLFPPTGDLPTELAWAIVVFIIITYRKIKTQKLGGYLKGFCDPIFLMAPFNILGEYFKPLSMSFRHFGNVVSGYVITALIYSALTVANSALFGLIPGAVGKVLGAIPFLTVGVPSVLSLYFDWFSDCMQAFIFCMLTMVFISTAED